MNEGFGKDFYTKGNSLKRSGPFSELLDSENWKSCCPHPLPKNQLLKKRTLPPPKENYLENFSGFKDNHSRPVVDTKILFEQKPGKPYLPPKSFLCGPDRRFFSARKSSALEQGNVCFLFPSISRPFAVALYCYRSDLHPVVFLVWQDPLARGRRSCINDPSGGENLLPKFLV